MKTFKDLFLDESADTDGTPRRTIKASLRMAATDNGLPTRLAPADSNEDNLSDANNQKKSGTVTDKKARHLHRAIRLDDIDHNRTGSRP